MKRFYAIFASFVLLFTIGCGGGGDDDNTQAPVLTKITLSPSTVSLNRGGVQQMSAVGSDQNDRAIAATITYSSSNTAVASVSPGGLVCAGTWDTNFINCTQGPAGTAEITAKSGNVTSNAVVISVHERVDAVTISSMTAGCVSQGQAWDFIARAFANGVDITSSVGTFTFTNVQTTVATLENVNPNVGRLKAAQPGLSGIFASVSGVNSPQAAFTACPVSDISLHVKDSTATTVNLAATGNTATLAADLKDSRNQPVTNATINYWSLEPVVASVSGTAVVTANSPGTTAIVASCTSGNCNIDMLSAYSNAVITTVAGTSPASTVYAATSTAPSGTASPTVIPVDTGTNAAGTAITLQAVPNSILFNRNGARAYLGAAASVMTLDAAANTVANSVAAGGKAVAISQDKVVLAAANFVDIVPQNTGTPNTYALAGVKAGAITPDSQTAFLVGGGNVYYIPFTARPGVRTTNLGGTLNDVSMLATGQAAYVAGPGSQVTVLATCDGSIRDNIPTAGTPQMLQRALDGRTVIAVDSTRIYEITASLTAGACPQAMSHTVAATDMGVGAITVTDVVVSPDSTKAYVIGNTGSVVVYDLVTNGVSTIALGSGATGALAADITPDGRTLWVSANNQTLKKIDLTTNTVTATVNLPFNADLMALRPR